MVLEEASSATEPTTTYTSDYNQPTSDTDPYSNSNANLTTTSSGYLQIPQPDPPGGEPLYINTATLPRPLGILPFAEAQHARNIANGVFATCTYASKVLQRPLRQDEADAFAFHWAKSMRTASFGTPVGVSIATMWAYRYSDFRFPGWKPFKSGSALSPESLGPLKGSAARAGWTFLRYNAWAAVGMVFGQLFFASYALTLHAANRALDPRLKDFTEALKMRQKEGLNRAREVREQRMGESRQEGQGETFEMARQRRVVQQQQHRGRERGRSTEDDDMSPTGGSFAEDFMDTAGGDTGVMSDGQSREQSYKVESNAAARYDMTSSRSSMDDFESSTNITRDSSMSAPYSTSSQPQQSTQQSPQQQQQQPQRSSSGGASAWERLRQNAMSGQPANPSSRGSTTRGTSSSSGSGSSDAFSFSQNEEDRQLAKSEAQRDFDARIEREREGKDFSSGRS